MRHRDQVITTELRMFLSTKGSAWVASAMDIQQSGFMFAEDSYSPGAFLASRLGRPFE
jgi:hypothetical protein